MQRVALSIIGGLLLVVAAVGLTEVTLAVGHRSATTDESVVSKATPTPSAIPTPTPTPSPSATPVATPTPVPAAPTAITTEQVRLRAAATVASAQLAWIDGGTVVTLGAYSDASWQQVTVNGLQGYINRAYLRY